MRNGADRTTGVAMGVGLGAVAVAGEGLEHAGNITASILRSEMCWFCKFLMILAMPLFFVLLIATFKMGAEVGVPITIGGTAAWVAFVYYLDRFGGWITKEEQIIKARNEVDEYNARVGSNYVCADNGAFYDKDDPESLLGYAFDPGGFSEYVARNESYRNQQKLELIRTNPRAYLEKYK